MDQPPEERAEGLLSSPNFAFVRQHCPLQAAPGLEAGREGRRRVVEDQGPPSGRAGGEPGKAPFLLLSQPPQRQGVP